MRALVTFAHALADETRWRIIHLVFDQSLCVCELADILALPQSTLSSQLQVIQKAELLSSERKGKWMFYRVQPAFRPLLKALFKHFSSSHLTNATLARDARKARTRLAQRDQACCPAPSRTRAAPSCP